jgi:predicted Zn finger-like uncharacterized protein
VIVECSNCQTRFQLDDSRVPLRGIRVRCSRCKEAFFLEHPGASEADAVHDVAGQVAAGAPPDSTQDLPPQSSVHDSGGSSHEPDEEDWEFNDDRPGDEDGVDHDYAGEESEGFDDELDDEDIEAAASEAADDVQIPGLGVDGMDDKEDAGGRGLDLDEGGSSGVDLGDPESDYEAIVVDEPAAESEEDASSDFGEVSDFSALAEDDPGPIVSEEPEPAVAQDPAAPQEVGEPEDWDFFSDESLEQPSSIGSMDNALGNAMAAVEADDASVAYASSGPDLGNVKLESPSRLGGLRSIGGAVGWMITLALFGVGLVGGGLEVANSRQAPPTQVDLGDFQAQQVRGGWFETVRSTQLYAVSGQLVNDSSQVRWPGAGLTVALLSPAGEPLEIAAPAGIPLAESQLRELSPDGLISAADQSVSQLAHVRLEPGQSVAFQAFFDGIPDQATSFVLEMEDVAPPPSVYEPDAGVLDPLNEGTFDLRPDLRPDLQPGLEAELPLSGAAPQVGAEVSAASAEAAQAMPGAPQEAMPPASAAPASAALASPSPQGHRPGSTTSRP